MSCTYGITIASAKGHSPSSVNPLSITLNLDSIHQINCLRATGYVAVSASGGVSAYTYLWSNGLQTAVADNLGPGNYSVTATDAEGSTAVLNISITENFTAPNADAGDNVDVFCSNSVTSLSGSGSAGPGFTYLWQVSNGGHILAGGNTLTPDVDHSGTYTLVVTNTQNGCTASDITTVSSQHQAPAATASGGTLNCLQGALNLSASYGGANSVFHWQGPGGFASVLLQPNVNTPGVYIFTVTDTVNTCATIITAPVFIDTLKPQVGATNGGPITCAMPSVLLKGTGAPANITFAWTGPNGFASALQNAPTSNAGAYQLIVTNPVNGCTAKAVTSITANTTPPTASASVGGAITCSFPTRQLTGNGAPAGIIFSWSGPSGYLSNLQSPVVSVPGQYILTTTNPVNGCTATASVAVTSNTVQPTISATGGLKTCSNPTVMLTTTANISTGQYSWSGPGNFSSNQPNPTVSQSGTYFVTITNPANGCSNLASANVTQNITAPVVSAVGATITCNNPLPKVTATSSVQGSSFAWSGPGGFSANIYNPTVSVGGSYVVTVTSPVNGCTNSTSAYVYENNTPPFVYAGEDRVLNCNITTIIMNPIGTTSGSNFTYLWTTVNGNIILGANSLYARANAPGTYVLTVTNTQTGCSASDEMEITQSPPVTATISLATGVSCFGGSNGTAKVNGGGGNGSYTYNWSSGAQAATANNLLAGTYTVTVTDLENCSATATAVITQPQLLQSTIVSSPQTIMGVNNGAASVSPTGGTTPYSVLWNNGKTTLSIGGLAPGTYTATITDHNGCSIDKTTTVSPVTCSIAGTVAVTGITCSGLNNGALTANITNAPNPVTYVWSNGAQTKTITGLAPATYTVTATDGAGCTLVLTTPLVAPQPLALSISGQNNVLCASSQNGSVTLNVTGGTSPYQYAWSNGNQTANPANLGVGNYTCTVTDTKGCSKTQVAQITATDNAPPVLVLKNASVALNANGVATVTPAMFDNGSTDGCGIVNWTVSPAGFDCEQIGVRTVTLTATDGNGNVATGTATVTVTDNIAPTLICPLDQAVPACSPTVTYNLPQVLDNCTQAGLPKLITGLPSGSVFPAGPTQQVYSYTDPGGNTSTCSFIISVNTATAFTLSSEPASCPSSCNGSASVTVTGGNPAADFHWSNGQSGTIATGLCPGTYSVTVTDLSGCSQTKSVQVTANNIPPFTSSISASPVSCSGTCDGSAQVTVSGTSQQISINWNTGQSGNTISDLCNGNYTATLTDAQGCSQTQSVQINVQDVLAPSLTCPGSVNVGFCNPAVSFAQPQVFDNCPVNLQQVQLIAGLPSGSVFPIGATTQTYRYTDSGGNVGLCNFTITVHPPASITVATNNVICAGQCNGQAMLTLTNGQAPYSIQWNTGNTGPNLLNLCAGSYIATITDGDGCQQVKTANISQPPSLFLSISQVTNDVGNTGSGSIDITVTGGTAPYSYLWKRNGQPFSTAEDLGNLFAGQYSVVVTDAIGCTVAEAAVTVNSLVAATEPDNSALWVLYPNPASAEVYMKTTAPHSGDIRLSLFDSAGNLLLEQTAAVAGDTPVKIDLSGMPDGLILVRIADGEKAAVKRLIKTRR